MEKFEGEVKLVNDYMFESYYAWNYITVHIYKFKDEEGKTYVWKTSSILGIDEIEGDEVVFTKAPVGSVVAIRGSIKKETEYKGEPQTVLSRVKVLKIINRALTKEEKIEIKRNEQIKSLNSGDFIYDMPYRQFKQHYSDCETLAGSYDDETGTIGVIVREGRLKNSGVRFKRFDTYRFRNESGTKIQCRYAVSEENARKRIEKDFPDEEWIFIGISYR